MYYDSERLERAGDAEAATDALVFPNYNVMSIDVLSFGVGNMMHMLKNHCATCNNSLRPPTFLSVLQH